MFTPIWGRFPFWLYNIFQIVSNMFLLFTSMEWQMTLLTKHPLSTNCFFSWKKTPWPVWCFEWFLPTKKRSQFAKASNVCNFLSTQRFILVCWSWRRCFFMFFQVGDKFQQTKQRMCKTQHSWDVHWSIVSMWNAYSTWMPWDANCFVVKDRRATN